MTGVADVAAAAAEAAFGRPLVMNVLRGLVVEAIVAAKLSSRWRWCSQDYHAWDFERDDGLRLEVKQSAVLQSWANLANKPTRCSFDIAARTGRFEGADWISDHRRWAEIYVFGHHAVVDASADHRDPLQWSFYVVPASRLPAQQTIALSVVRAMVDPICAAGLKEAVELVAVELLGAPA